MTDDSHSLGDLPSLLPDRTLTMKEGEAVARACNAECLNRVTYDDDDAEPTRRVWLLNLLVDGRFIMVTYGDSWQVEQVASGLRDSEFYDALNDTFGEAFGVGVEPAESVWYDDDGEVIERYDSDGLL